MDIKHFILLNWIWIGIALIIFPILFKITVPYGRHSKRSWGAMTGNRLGWILMESTSLLVFSICFLWNGFIHGLASWLFFAVWLIHYINRSYVFPSRLMTKGKKMPLAIMFMAILFNFMNGFLNGYFQGNLSNYSPEWFYSPQFISGSMIFTLGMMINMQSDSILISLRKNNSNGYFIPYGKMFRYISCPNHFGEIIEWAGFAVMTWSLPGLAFFIWTVVNLMPRSLDHHRWYKREFQDYPKNRKALIPFIL
ncbi:MAG: DUF1295 domain-containing protein [Bacteroidetes bacterium]|nr:DUF1295 domain-containing protein [Bacteroidota bacterium]